MSHQKLLVLVVGFRLVMGCIRMLLLLLTTLIWAVFDIYRKMLGKVLPIASILFFTFLSQVIVFACLPKNYNFTLNYLPLLLLSGVTQTLGSYYFILALRDNRFSDVIPLLGISPLLTVLSDLFFGIIPSNNLLLGLVLILLGTIFLVRKKSLPMIYAGSFWGIGVAVDHQALNYASLATHGLGTSLIALTFLSLIFFREIRVSINYKFKKEISIIFLLGSSAYLAELYCLQAFSAGYFEVFNKGFCFLISLVMGAVLFKEKIYRSQAFSVITICLGTIVIAS